MESKILKQIKRREYDKYMRLHVQNYGSTGYQRHISEYVRWTADPAHKILDMGCGCGVAVDYLLQEGRNAFGVDITLAGVKSDMKKDAFSRIFTEAPLWALPFKDDEFDYTFSADVLEHIPPVLIDAVIAEIYRVTSKQTLHVIATRYADTQRELHLIVESIWWWRELFLRDNKKGLKCMIVDCDEFLMLHEKKAKEMNIPVKCTCSRILDNKAALSRHLEIHKTDAKHLPDLTHNNTKLLFPHGVINAR